MNYWYLIQALVLFFASVAALPIHEAASFGSLAEVRRLVGENSENLYAVDHSGWTPLHLAAHEGHVDIVDCLLGMDRSLVKLNNRRGLFTFSDIFQVCEPWELAYQGHHGEVVAYFLIFAGAKSKIIDDDVLAKKRSWLIREFEIARPGCNDQIPQDFYQWIDKEYWLLWSESWGRGALFSSVLQKIQASPFEELNHLQKFNLLYEFSQEPSSFSLYNEIMHREHKLLNLAQAVILVNRIKGVSKLA